jgi:hypothetical protein
MNRQPHSITRMMATLAVALILSLVAASTTHAAKPGKSAEIGHIEADCRGNTDSKTTVVNIPGWDFRTWGWVRLRVGDVHVCNYRLLASWDDDHIDFMHQELDRLVASNEQVIIVAYSMSAPFITEVLDTWVSAELSPQTLDELDLVLIAPAARVHGTVRGFVIRLADRWNHAWKAHFEKGVMRNNHIPQWNALLDRTHLILANRDVVVDYEGIGTVVFDRLGQNVQTLEGRHVDLRKAPEISNLVLSLVRPL